MSKKRKKEKRIARRFARVFINGEEFFFRPTHSGLSIVGMILSRFSHLKNWNYHSLKKLYVGTFVLVEEILVEEASQAGGAGYKTRLTRFIKEQKKAMKYLPKDRDKILSKIFELILRSDNLGLLRGFGMANLFGDSVKGNPELSPMKYVYPQLLVEQKIEEERRRKIEEKEAKTRKYFTPVGYKLKRRKPIKLRRRKPIKLKRRKR